MEISAPACKASMNALVPDLAMVPRLLIKSALVIPMPVSTMVRVRSCLFGIRLMCSSFPESNLLGSVKLSYLILSKAYLKKRHVMTHNIPPKTVPFHTNTPIHIERLTSDEFEISSLRKISLFE